MRAQASYVRVRKTYCYRTDTRTKNLQIKGIVDEAKSTQNYKTGLEALTGRTQH